MKVFVLFSIICALVTLGDQSTFKWVSFNMVKRTTGDGKITKVVSDIYYKKSGEMVTHFQKPLEMYVLNNQYGDVRMYNPQSNTVIKTLDNRIGSQNTTYYYFLNGQSADLGLASAGFILMDSRIEDMMLITEWEPPSEVKNQVTKVELVSNGEVPVFMGYLDKKGNYTKKIYYYDYDYVGEARFPFSITEVDYLQQDSLITKTTFDAFQFDRMEDLEQLNFEIPKNAQLIE